MLQRRASSVSPADFRQTVQLKSDRASAAGTNGFCRHVLQRQQSFARGGTREAIAAVRAIEVDPRFVTACSSLVTRNRRLASGTGATCGRIGLPSTSLRKSMRASASVRYRNTSRPRSSRIGALRIWIPAPCVLPQQGRFSNQGHVARTKKESELVSSLSLSTRSALRGLRTKARVVWLRGKDLNLRPSGYEPDELPDCSTPRQVLHLTR